MKKSKQEIDLLADRPPDREQELLSAIMSKASRAISIIDDVTPIQIRIEPSELEEADVETLKLLFLTFLEIKPNTMVITIRLHGRSIPFTDKFYQLDKNNFKAGYVSYPKLIDLADTLINNAYLFIGLQSAFQAYGLPVYVYEYSDRLFRTIDGDVSLTRGLPPHALRILSFLYEINPNILKIEGLFKAIIKMLVSHRCITLFESLTIPKPVLTQLLDDNFNVVLGIIMKRDYQEGLLFLLDFLELKDIKPNVRKYTLLHLYEGDDEKFMELLLKFVPNINVQGTDGVTALHMAALSSNLTKAQFLLSHGANPLIEDYKNENFWQIKQFLPERTSSLDLFRDFHQHGKTLAYPPKIVMQRGPNCGSYAVNCAIDYLRMWKPDSFTTQPIVARKGDVKPKASISLRQMLKESTLSMRGEVFFTASLEKLIAAAEGKSLVVDLTDDINHFSTIIQKMIDIGLPLIIPFSTADSTGNEFSGASAHWACIIGYKIVDNEMKLLVAQYGRYQMFDAKDLFKRCYNIESEFPQRYVVKTANKSWSLSETLPKAAPDVRVETIPTTNLDQFRRKLIVVMPKDYDISEINNMIHTPVAPGITSENTKTGMP